MNCSHGTWSGLVNWWPRCTEDALSGTGYVIPNPYLSPASAVVLLNGGAYPMMPALSMTPASVLVPVPFPQLSLHVRSYRPITPSLCALGQQVIIAISSYCSYHASCPYHPDHSYLVRYCSWTSIVLTSSRLSDYRWLGWMSKHICYSVPLWESPKPCRTAYQVTTHESVVMCHQPTQDWHQGCSWAPNFPVYINTQRARTNGRHWELYQVRHQHRSQEPKVESVKRTTFVRARGCVCLRMLVFCSVLLD